MLHFCLWVFLLCLNVFASELSLEAAVDPQEYSIPQRGIADPESFKNTLSDKGYLTKNSIIHLFQEMGLMQVPLQIRELEKGTYSGSIFEVKTGAGTYVVKTLASQEDVDYPEGASPLKEIQDLTDINQSSLMKLPFEADPNLPMIMASLYNFFYLDHWGHKKYVSIMPKAQGKPVWGAIWSYLTAQDSGRDPPVAFEMMQKMGRALGELHYRMAQGIEKIKANLGEMPFNTVAHNDFTVNNIFYGFSTKRISLIDCADFAYSLRTPKSNFLDVMYIYSDVKYKQALGPSYEDPQRVNNLFEYFALGYAQAFPLKVQRKVFERIVLEFEILSRTIADKIRRNVPLQLDRTHEKTDTFYYREPWNQFIFNLSWDKIIKDRITGEVLNEGGLNIIRNYLLSDPWVQ